MPVRLTAEVQQHIGQNQVRAVAMSIDRRRHPRHGGRSTPARPITVPVGDAALGRILNVLGEPVDGGAADSRRHASAGRSTARRPKFTDLEPKTEIFETGIKVIDLIAPFVKGGKIGLFGGAGVGKTVVIMELINNVAEGPRRQVGVLRRGRAHPRGERPLPRDEGERRPRDRAR